VGAADDDADEYDEGAMVRMRAVEEPDAAYDEEGAAVAPLADVWGANEADDDNDGDDT